MRNFGAYRCKRVDTKYGMGSVLRRLPLFRDNCNGIFSVEKLPCAARQFHSGTKKLLYDVTMGNDLSLLVGHFSLHASVRQRQFQEIGELVKGRGKTIVCGDFNDYGGIKELTPLLRSADLRVIRATNPATFPACHPRLPLDLFLCSEGITDVKAEVLSDVRISDHLPVLLTVSM
ncbi:hypothetical protein FJZ27_03095 [Candidatus Peribacteria bacterium]|nr:hypothetical protein [Candidatus Peribacteria bacterium]